MAAKKVEKKNHVWIGVIPEDVPHHLPGSVGDGSEVVRMVPGSVKDGVRERGDGSRKRGDGARERGEGARERGGWF